MDDRAYDTKLNKVPKYRTMTGQGFQSAPSLVEKEYKFSRAPFWKLGLAGLLGLVNVLGIMFLSSIPLGVIMETMGGVPAAIAAILPLLQVEECVHV